MLTWPLTFAAAGVRAKPASTLDGLCSCSAHIVDRYTGQAGALGWTTLEGRRIVRNYALTALLCRERFVVCGAKRV